jgi:hypothetical protein
MMCEHRFTRDRVLCRAISMTKVQYSFDRAFISSDAHENFTPVFITIIIIGMLHPIVFAAKTDLGGSSLRIRDRLER